MTSDRIKSKANELGFEFVGITPAIPPPHFNFFTKWLLNGYAGEMEYLHRTAPVRTDSTQLLHNAKSIVMVGLSYAQQPAPHIAMYALGDDYHEVMRDKLNQLLDWIKAEYPEIEGRACVDSAPIMERDMAWQAGLGWFGKNTCLINTRHGSYFFLGALLLNI
ncbi:MAG: QueG-associated DUF1730 domain-containing protein, partial [bacterium]